MIATARARFVRISPRKVRYVIDLIRRKTVPEARAILSGTPRRAGSIIQKLLDQAINAAERNKKVGASSLYVSRVTADGGPMMKRFRAASMGRATAIRKRMSHICLELDLQKGVAPTAPAPKTKAKAEPKGRATKSTPVKAKKLVGAK